MIQYICFDPSQLDESFQDKKDILISTFSKPRSFDQFDINVLDLNNKSIWINKKEPSETSIDCKNDLKRLGQMISNSKDAAIIIVFPQNLTYQYLVYKPERYTRFKDMLKNLSNYFLRELVPEDIIFDIGYEISDTIIGGKTFESDFYFRSSNCQERHISKGNNCMTIQKDRLFLTTLKIENLEAIELIIKDFGLVKAKSSTPEWMEDIHMFDDEIQRENISLFNQEIKEIEKKKEEAERLIAQNNRYKSILYTNGDELVEVVFEILEQMLACNLSGFKDEKKEDFIIETFEKTFIGEIKGVTSNVKSENVSQLDVHYQTYLEEREVEESKVKALLIMNPFRNKPLDQRDPIHEKQIKLAKRNESLIISTYTLLKLFEEFRNEKRTSEECANLLFNHAGLLEIG